MSVPLRIIIICICILFSAFFSATETAFTSMNRTRLKTLVAEKGNKRAALALKLEEKYNNLLTTILIGNNIVNILASSLSTLLFLDIMADKDLAATVSTIVITVAVLIFGEITPKSVAKDMPERFAMFSAPFIQLLMWVLSLFVLIFSGWQKLVVKVFKLGNQEKMSQEELLMFVEEVEQEGSIDADESELLKNAIEFTDRKAEDILTHRTDLEGIPVDASNEEVARAFTETKFSRLLVYEDSIDNIVGIVNQKDFYLGGGTTKRSLKNIMTEPLFVLKSEMVDDLLRKLQKAKSHIAVVLDEYGGTLGIVTMEDILEELVGEIWDEHDEVVEMFKKVSDDVYIVDCSADLDEFCELFGLETGEESVSLSGWVMEHLGEIPEKGDTFSVGDYDMVVTEVDNHRVEKIRVTRVEREESEEKED